MVYSANQLGFDRRVAVKVLMVAGISEDRDRQAFERECRAMGQLSDHPYIVTVFTSTFTQRGEPVIVMELCPGGTLSEKTKRCGRLPIEEVLLVLDMVFPSRWRLTGLVTAAPVGIDARPVPSRSERTESTEADDEESATVTVARVVESKVEAEVPAEVRTVSRLRVLVGIVCLVAVLATGALAATTFAGADGSSSPPTSVPTLSVEPMDSLYGRRMTISTQPDGGFRFVTGISAYSGGVIAEPAHIIHHVTLREWLPWQDGLERPAGPLSTPSRTPSKPTERHRRPADRRRS